MAAAINIEVDQDVLSELKRNAEPFVDTPNSVLRRLLGLDAPGESRDLPSETSRESIVVVRAGGATRSSRPGTGKEAHRRARSEDLLPLDEYFGPILRAIRTRGGKAGAEEVIADVGRALREQLRPADRQRLKGGKVRWKTRVQFARLELVKKGHMPANSPRGLWEITALGTSASERASGAEP